MVFFLCVRRNAFPVGLYLRTIWPHPSGARVEPVHYEDLADFVVRPGLYIFADIELMDGPQRAAAMALYDRLVANPARYRVWNNPRDSARRFDVLDWMAREGGNRFRAYRESEPLPAGVRYPVFVRDEHEHKGALSPLLDNEQAVREAVAGLRAGERPDGPLLIVEYLAFASSDGVYRKYGVFRMGDRFIRKHVLFSSDWMLREPEEGRYDEPVWLDEEWKFINGEPDIMAQLQTIFDHFKVDYGRVDFTVLEGRVEVFEINTNPIIIKQSYYRPGNPRLRVHRHFKDEFIKQLDRSDPADRPGLAHRLWWRMHKPKLDPTPWWRRYFPGWKKAPASVGENPPE